MKKLNTSLPFNYFHYYAFVLVIVLLGLSCPLCFLLIIPFLKLLKNYQHKGAVIGFGIVFLAYVLFYPLVTSKKPIGSQFKVNEKIAKTSYNTYFVTQKGRKYLFYSKEKFEIGDTLRIDYTAIELSKERTPNGFNQKNYYASKRIYYQLLPTEIEVIKNSFHPNKIKEKLKTVFNKYPPITQNYLKLFILAEDEFEEDFKTAKTKAGIAHLFALSGLHFNFIFSGIILLFKRFNLKARENIIFPFMFGYLWLTGFSLSLFRALLMAFIYFKFKSQNITKLDSLSFAFIIMILINPFYRFRVGFILSFLISFFLLTIKIERSFRGLIKVHLVAFFSSLLIVSNLNNGIYPFSLITGFIYTLIFPFLIMPIIYLSLIPGFHFISEPLLSGFNHSINTFSFGSQIKMPYQSSLAIVFYLMIFVFVLFAKDLKSVVKRSVGLLLFTFLVAVFPNYNPNGKVYFLDVGQGDTTLITRPCNSCNVLIDAHTGTLNFLKTLGDFEIDYFFLTHGDYDHVSEAEQIIKEIKVKRIYTNPYDDSELIRDLEKYHLKYTKAGDIFYCGDLTIHVLGPLRDYQSSNNNSLVLQTKIDDQVYLFTGDIEQEAEFDLANTYRRSLKSDILHVAHHGAKTGTTMLFLDYVNPQEAIISVGLFNYYNHPDKQTIANLKSKNIKIYQTSKNQTIVKRKYRFFLTVLLYKKE